APQRLVLEERPVLDRAIHAHQILEEDAAGADGQVADLGVAHLAGRQPDRLARRGDRRVRARLPEPVEERRVGERDGVAGAVGRAAEAVEDDERDERKRVPARHASAPARQIAANESGSSEAPPTRAPSTAGWAKSS